jgi:putative tricarboxylic transport membrane protein
MERSTLLNRDFISSLVWVVIGLIFCVGGVRYGVYYAGGPGPGFLAFVGGIILSSLGLAVLISTCLHVKEKRDEVEKFFPEEDSFKKVFLTIMALCLYALLFEYLGFLFTTFLIMFFLLRFIDPLKWSTVWITAILTATIFYIAFQVVIGIPFPRGIFNL